MNSENELFKQIGMLRVEVINLEEAKTNVEKQCEELLKALTLIYEFGKKNSGCGFTCSKMAEEALQKIKGDASHYMTSEEYANSILKKDMEFAFNVLSEKE